MDVGNPSNFERLVEIFKGSWEGMAGRIEGRSVTDTRTLETMKRMYDEHGQMMDPHTAVGVAAALDHLESAAASGAPVAGPESPRVIVLSTAHPAKFSDIVQKATGKLPEMPERLARCLSLPKQSVPIGARLSELSEYLMEMFG